MGMRRNYTKEFKVKAVRLALHFDKSSKEIADEPGIKPDVLYKRRRSSDGSGMSGRV